MLKKFNQNDVFYNQIKAYPKKTFFIYDRKVYIDNTEQVSGTHRDFVDGTRNNTVDLYELDVNKPSYSYPFITKNGSLSSFKTISTTEFNSDFSYGDTITGSYPLTAGISKDRYSLGQSRPHIVALRNTLNYYLKNSPHFAYSSNYGNKETQEIGLISIPSIFYGSSIKKGSVKLDFYIAGSLVGRLEDIRRNGELVQTAPVGSNGSGSVAGVVLYSEGFIVLTGSWDISAGTHTEPYIPGEAATAPKWIYFASTGSTGALENLPSSSFYIEYNGSQNISTINMLCRAENGEMNCSNNPTFVRFDADKTPMTGTWKYVERDNIEIKNITYSKFSDYTSSFEKTTYITNIGIYDEDKNLIMVAKLATPIKKTENTSLTFKLKLDV